MKKQRLEKVKILFVEEGPGFIVIGHDAAGREYTLLDEAGDYRMMSYVAADMVIDRIKAAGGIISLEHWSCRAPYGTNAWLIDGMEERQIEDERFGYF